jgi:hypothetical protein
MEYPGKAMVFLAWTLQVDLENMARVFAFTWIDNMMRGRIFF